MRPFSYRRAADTADAVRSTPGRPGEAATSAATQFIAGGTTLLDLMKLDTMRPQVLVDILDLGARHAYIRHDDRGLHLGALTRMQAVADDPGINRFYPVIAQSMQLAASPQLRNMATLGGNVLQRTRCNYFRNGDWAACNKRDPGSGCSALSGLSRKHAVLGVSDQCISAYPGDFAQALVALGATVEMTGAAGRRSLPFESLHLGPEHPEHETVLRPGELITSFLVPAGPWTRRSVYVKVRDRASYEFGLATAAVALHLDGAKVLAARIGLGGVAYRPWRAHEAEAALSGQTLNEQSAQAAAQAAFAGAVTHGSNAFKPALGRHTLARALLQAGSLELG
jgi:xanthine dehydrogenase YagS FAD-binding subunit